MKANEAEILVANTSAMIGIGDSRVRLTKGKTTARRGSKIVKGREHLFTPLVVDFELPNNEPKAEVFEAAEEPPRRGPGRPRKNPEPEPTPEPPVESGPLMTSDAPIEGSKTNG